LLAGRDLGAKPDRNEWTLNVTARASTRRQRRRDGDGGVADTRRRHAADGRMRFQQNVESVLRVAARGMSPRGGGCGGDRCGGGGSGVVRRRCPGLQRRERRAA